MCFCRKNKFFIVIITVVLASCTGKLRLNQALESAGENRSELGKVLNHYSQSPADSLKYRAACFLIENMPGHYSVDLSLIEKIQPVYDEHRKISERFGWEKDASWGASIDSLKDVYRKRYAVDFMQHPNPDIRHVTSGYLIREIDLAFQAWQENFYSHSIPFSDFCEYVLPYRRQDSYLLEDSRSQFYERHTGFFSGSHVSFQEATDSLLSGYKDFIHNDFYGASIPVYSISAMEHIKRGLCEHRCYFNSNLLSALGMPVVIDFVPHWGNRRNSHFWNALAMNGESFPFEPYWEYDPWKYKTLYDNTSRHERWGKFRLPKVFRHMYSRTFENPATDKTLKIKDIPPLFRNLNLKDVSSQYFQTMDIKIRLTEPLPPGAEYCYLAVFGQRKWHIVQWGKIADKECLFKDMGRDIVYLPVYFIDGQVIPAASPFYLEPSGRIKELVKTDKTISVSARSVDSQVSIPDMMNACRYISNGYIMGIRDLPEKGIDTLHQIPADVDLWYNTVYPDTPKTYRTVRLQAPGKEFRLCEIAFYVQDAGKERRIYPKSIESILIPSDSSNQITRVTDGVSSTGFRGKISDLSQKAHVDFDLGDLYHLSRIVYVPYSVSYIYPDSEYELFYWDRGWKSVGVKKLKNEVVSFDNVPQGCLYMIWDKKDRLQYQRIFMYEDGYVIWM
jgi:hypothetical protein